MTYGDVVINESLKMVNISYTLTVNVVQVSYYRRMMCSNVKIER